MRLDDDQKDDEIADPKMTEIDARAALLELAELCYSMTTARSRGEHDRMLQFSSACLKGAEALKRSIRSGWAKRREAVQVAKAQTAKTCRDCALAAAVLAKEDLEDRGFTDVFECLDRATTLDTAACGLFRPRCEKSGHRDLEERDMAECL